MEFQDLRMRNVGEDRFDYGRLYAGHAFGENNESVGKLFKFTSAYE